MAKEMDNWTSVPPCCYRKTKRDTAELTVASSSSAWHGIQAADSAAVSQVDLLHQSDQWSGCLSCPAYQHTHTHKTLNQVITNYNPCHLTLQILEDNSKLFISA